MIQYQGLLLRISTMFPGGSMTDAMPTVVQLWFKKSQQLPRYLKRLRPYEDTIGFNPEATPGVEVVPKDRETSVDVGDLHGQLVTRGLTLTHASYILRPALVAGQNKTYHIVRFHYFPNDVARVHNGVDTELLVNAFQEICAMGYFNLNVHVNSSETGYWMSINLDGRVQRYIGEDTTKPVMKRLGPEGPKEPIQPTRKLKLEGDLLELV